MHFNCVIINVLLWASMCSSNDPYNALGLKNIATSEEIRLAYRQLAKEWHPDKSQTTDGAEKFFKIKSAYELLTDTERRRIYDLYGITDENSHYLQKKYDYSEYNRFSNDQFDDIFLGNQFPIGQDIGLFHKLSVTANYFEKIILPNSEKKVYLILFYNDWCFRCIKIVEAFKKLKDLLEPLGINFATINAVYEPSTFRKTGSDGVPKLIVVLKRNFFIFRDDALTPPKVVEFIRKKMPFNILHRIESKNINAFLSGWMDNKVRALIFEPRSQIRLRYLLTAFEFYDRVTFGFIDISNGRAEELVSRYNISRTMDSLFIFNEDPLRYVTSISMSDIPTKTLRSVVSSHQFLALPRLSSQEILDKICPKDWSRPRKRLCVVLITNNSVNNEIERNTLRNIALKREYNYERVRFAYMFKERQKNFIKAISKGFKESNIPHIVVLWRRDDKHLKYEWIFGVAKGNSSATGILANSTKHEVSRTVRRLLKSSESFNYEAVVQLFNEHSEGKLSMWLSRIIYLIDSISDQVENEHLLAALSLLGTIALMLAVGYLLMYFVRIEEDNLRAQGFILSYQDAQPTNRIPELKLYELRAEKYNGMVRLLKPGFRTLLLITDYQTRKKLIPDFHKAVWPYRKTKTLLFGHLLIEKGLSWYSELLRLSLCESQKLQVNPRNCVGTVIALNGHRKYFCMYHAKHPESIRVNKRILKITKQLLTNEDDPEAGTFLEDNFSDESETEGNVVLEDNLLKGFDKWLDRLFDGTTHKYYINYWPDFSTK
nr:dnaJ homolog subfamily C member 16 isoform X2 [Drosophila bipectinata]